MESLEQTETGPTTHSVIHAPCGDRMWPLVLFCSMGRLHAWCNQRLKKCSAGILESPIKRAVIILLEDRKGIKKERALSYPAPSGDSRHVRTDTVLCVSVSADTTGAEEPPS